MLLLALMAQVFIAPPPVVSVPPRSVGSSTPRTRYPIAVEMKGGGAVLWSGTIQVGGGIPTSLNHRLSEPGPECGALNRRTYDETSYTLTLYARSDQGDGPPLQVNASWTRSDADGCASPAGSRTVSFTRSVDLPPGQAAVLRGDGGLVVTLRRP